jgi:hypothetical protein
MLFKARNKNLRAVQTVIGVYLHANGVPTQVITLLSQYGISVGLDSLETIMESLDKDQVERLKALGRQMPSNNSSADPSLRQLPQDS